MAVTVLTGDSEQVDQALARIETDFLKQNNGLGLVRLRAGQIHDLLSLKADLSGASLFSRSQLIILRDFDQGPWLISPETGDPGGIIDQILASLHPGNHLVLILAKPVPAPSWLKRLQSQTDYHDFRLLTETEMISYLQDQARKRGRDLSRPAARLLISQRGPDLAGLTKEIIKLCWHDRISPELIQAVVPVYTPEIRSFALTDQLVARNLKASQKLYRNLRALDPSPQGLLKLLGSICWQIKLLIALKSYPDHFDLKKLAQSLGLKSSYPLQKSGRLAARISHQQLSLIVDSCLKADRQIRLDQLDPDTCLENLIIKICLI